MIRIATICLLISMVRSQNCNFNDEEIDNLKNIFSKTSNYVKIGNENKDAIVCLGAARAGKSTLVNYLIGNKLKGVRLKRFSKISLEKVDNRSPGPEIGAGVQSNTIFPSGWQSQTFKNAIIWDTPGFGDNRGVTQDISNAFYIYELLKNVNALKIVLVINFQNIISDNIDMFLSILRNVEQFFGNNLRQYFSSISLIVSKAEYARDDVPVDNIFVKDVLKRILNTDGLDISKNCRDLIEYITENSNRIGLFRTAKNIGEINSDIDYNIVQAIDNSGYIKKEFFQDLHPTISVKSQLCLHSARLKLAAVPEINELHNLVIKTFNEMLQPIILPNSSIDKITAAQRSLLSMKTRLKTFEESNTFTAYKGVEFLQSINDKLQNKIKNDDILRKIELVEFINMVLQEPINTELNLVVKNIYKTALEILENNIIQSANKIHEISEEEKHQKHMEIESARQQEAIQKLQLKIDAEKKEKQRKKPSWYAYVACRYQRDIARCLESD